MSNTSGPPASDRDGRGAEPLLGLLDCGKDVWADEHADEYVNRLRDNWELIAT
ncbi:MAG TPA: hypothetical protein VKV95_05925 [Terriglobia bacterium]|nr:hypothetical protein [Terriglobia bacterium]